ncbi:MAG: type II toxin-antitoxin system VapC family toxin [Acidobacteria bacterium]|nr:type II toxin-antitoxin system VapC family toxin [Acidobacteriota bacterium]
MAAYYADSSALVKRHVPEIGSAWFTTLADPSSGNVIVTARLSLAEIYSALNRRVREASVTPADYVGIISDLNSIWASDYEIVELTQPLVDETRLLCERYPLRAYDAVQLASAIFARSGMQAVGAPPLIFLSADGRLLTAAQAEGFVTDNPNLH